MTFHQLINCLLLTFGPPAIIYKCSVLTEYGSFWNAYVGLLAYLVTQAVKILLMAAIFNNLSPLWELAIDCVGMYYFLVHQQTRIIPSVRILRLALGWSVGDFVCTRAIKFLLNARSAQFDWNNLVVAGEASLVMMQTLCLCALMWNWNRKANRFYLAMLIVYLLTSSYFATNIPLRLGIVSGLSLVTLMITN